MKTYLIVYYTPFTWLNTYFFNLAFLKKKKMNFTFNLLFFFWKKQLTFIKQNNIFYKIDCSCFFRMKKIKVLSNKSLITKLNSTSFSYKSFLLFTSPFLHCFSFFLKNFYHFSFWLGYYVNITTFIPTLQLLFNSSPRLSIPIIKKKTIFLDTRTDL